MDSKDNWIVKFSYYEGKNQYHFDKEFEVKEGETIDQLINKYVAGQNAGEPKSDRIKFVSKKQKP